MEKKEDIALPHSPIFHRQNTLITTLQKEQSKDSFYNPGPITDALWALVT